MVFLGRCGEATNEADWARPRRTAGELSVAADELSAAAAAVTRDETATNPDVLLSYIDRIGERPTD